MIHIPREGALRCSVSPSEPQSCHLGRANERSASCARTAGRGRGGHDRRPRPLAAPSTSRRRGRLSRSRRKPREALRSEGIPLVCYGRRPEEDLSFLADRPARATPRHRGRPCSPDDPLRLRDARQDDHPRAVDSHGARPFSPRRLEPRAPRIQPPLRLVAGPHHCRFTGCPRHARRGGRFRAGCDRGHLQRHRNRALLVGRDRAETRRAGRSAFQRALWSSARSAGCTRTRTINFSFAPPRGFAARESTSSS